MKPIPNPLTVPTIIMERLKQEAADYIRDNGKLHSVFRKVEAILASSSERQRALGFVADREAMEKHHDVIDFLFCELYPERYAQLVAFYEDRGEQLSSLMTAEEARVYEHGMFCALVLAVAIQEDVPPGAPCPVSWRMICKIALELAAQTHTMTEPAPSH